MFLLLLLALSGPVAVARPADEAEVARLVQEMETQLQRDRWKAVERAYGRILGVEDAVVPVDAHLYGAQVALHRGDTLQAYLRLQRAIAVDPYAPPVGSLAEVHRTLNWISTHYGRVRLVAEGRQELRAHAPPFTTNELQSIAWARDVLDDTGRFRGYLPVGRYNLGGVEFAVEAGAFWKDVSAVDE